MLTVKFKCIASSVSQPVLKLDMPWQHSWLNDDPVRLSFMAICHTACFMGRREWYVDPLHLGSAFGYVLTDATKQCNCV